MFGDHEFKSFRRARRVAGDHRVARHNRADGCQMGIKALCSDLYVVTQRRHSSMDSKTRHTRYARSFAVKIPLKPSSSSTTRTQSVRLAAHSWLASATVMFSGTVKAGLGLRAATVPFAGIDLPERFEER